MPVTSLLGPEILRDAVRVIPTGKVEIKARQYGGRQVRCLKQLVRLRGTACAARQRHQSLAVLIEGQNGGDFITVCVWIEHGSLLLNSKRDFRAVRAARVDPLRCLDEIGAERLGNFHKPLGVAVGEGKPTALNLHHDAMAGTEGVRDIGHGKCNAVRLAGFEGYRLLEALAELAAERLPAN